MLCEKVTDSAKPAENYHPTMQLYTALTLSAGSSDGTYTMVESHGSNQPQHIKPQAIVSIKQAQTGQQYPTTPKKQRVKLTK